MWVNYPNNPTTVIAKKDFYADLINITRKYNVIVASDEAYIDIYEDEIPPSILEATNDWSNIVAFHSLSKRNNATGLRIGFVVGGEEIIMYFLALKTQIDSGVANVLQEAAVYAFRDDSHTEYMRKVYSRRRSLLKRALERKGIKCYSEATIYIWAKVNDSISFVKRLLSLDNERKIGINIPRSLDIALRLMCQVA